MRLPPRRMAIFLTLVLPVVCAVGFHRLLAEPGGLVVDGTRRSLDHADRGHSRGIGNDLTSVFLPRFCYLIGQTKAFGQWPYWDTTGFGGRPLVSNPQAGLYYPPVWAAYLSGRPSALGWLTVAHLLWAGVGVYVLTRSLGFRPLSAIIAGGCYEASPYLIAHTFEGHYPHVWSACWYPWAFWSLSLALKRSRLGLCLLPVVLALTFLTGHPQEWYYLVLALSVWVLVDTIQSCRTGIAREGIAGALVWGGLLALSLGFCAVELMPEMGVGSWGLKSSVVRLRSLNRYYVHAVNLFQLLSPFALGRPEAYRGHDNYWETLFSVGLTPLVLAVIGVLRHPDRAMVRRWGGLVVVSAVFAGGRRLWLYSLAFTTLPGMDRFRVPSRTLFLASLGASVLAGAGVDAILRRGWTRAEWRAFRSRLGCVLVATGILVVAAQCLLKAKQSSIPSEANGFEVSDFNRAVDAVAAVAGEGYFWLSLFGMVGLAWGFTSTRRNRAFVGWGLGILALVELSLYAQSLLVCAPAGVFMSRSVLGGLSESDRVERSGPVRVVSAGLTFPDLSAAIEGWEKTNINDGFQIQHAADLYERLYPFLDVARPLRETDGPMDTEVLRHKVSVAQTVLDLMSVRFVVSDQPLLLPGLKTVTTVACKPDGPKVWRNAAALPRAYVVPHVVEERPGRIPVMIRLCDIDHQDAVLMEHDPLVGSERQPFTPAEWVSHGPDSIEIHVETTAPGLLVVGNTWMPGWSATVDGRPAQVFRGNHWQQVVALKDAGRHRVVLRFQPPGYRKGLTVTTASLVGWAGLSLCLGIGVVRRSGRALHPERRAATPPSG